MLGFRGLFLFRETTSSSGHCFPAVSPLSLRQILYGDGIHYGIWNRHNGSLLRFDDRMTECDILDRSFTD